MTEFIHPPQSFTNPDLPTVFLAGPVQGAPDWQSELATKLLRSGFAMNVASPRRHDLEDPAVRAAFDEAAKHAQIDWELDNIKRALKFGVLVINFVAQDPNVPYPAGRSYSQTTRFETGGAILGLEFYNEGRPNPNIALSIDPDYQGGNADYARRIAKRNNVPVYDGEAGLINEVILRLHELKQRVPS